MIQVIGTINKNNIIDMAACSGLIVNGWFPRADEMVALFRPVSRMYVLLAPRLAGPPSVVQQLGAVDCGNEWMFGIPRVGGSNPPLGTKF